VGQAATTVKTNQGSCTRPTRRLPGPSSDPDVRDHLGLDEVCVTVLDSSGDDGAVTRVLIASNDGDDTWTTMGGSSSVIDAS